MSDLVYLLGQLVDKSGKILVPHIYDQVDVLTQDEQKLYSAVDFDPVMMKVNVCNRY